MVVSKGNYILGITHVISLIHATVDLVNHGLLSNVIPATGIVEDSIQFAAGIATRGNNMFGNMNMSTLSNNALNWYIYASPFRT